MRSDNKDVANLNSLIKDLQTFIELSLKENETPLKEWLEKAMIINNFESRCYITNDCEEKDCPAFRNESGRCWLIAGTMCGGKPHGRFIKKYGLCTKCDFFLNTIANDPAHKIRELIIILVHSFEIKRAELKEALSSIKILKGFLPICSSCKKIRDDNGYWNQIESYISDHSEAKFSHGICEDCCEELYGNYDWFDKVTETSNHQMK